MTITSAPRITLLLLLAGCAADLGEPGDEIGEDSSAVAVCGSSIQSAIDAAPPGAVLVMCAGTYNERLIIRNKSLTLRGADGAASTIIDAGGAGPVLVVVNTPAPGVTVRGLTLRNGSNAGAGGGVRCTDSRLIVSSSVVADNSAVGGGGGLYARGCALTVTATLFQGNDGHQRSGGGAWVVDSSGVIRTSRFIGNQAELGGGVTLTRGTLALRDSEVRDNRSSVRGGGLYLASNASVVATTIADNASDWIAGGVYVFQNAPTISQSTIRGNTSVNDGGGLYIHQSRVQLLDNTIAGNLAQDDGGGVRVFESRARLERNVIENNESGDGGGGIRLSHLQSLLIDNVVRNNSSGNIGGGVELDNDSSVVRGGLVSGNTSGAGGGVAITLAPDSGCRVDGVDIVDNDATVGGGLYVADNYVPVTLRRLTVEGNQANRGAGLDVRATDFTLDHSVFAGNIAAAEGGAIAHRPPAPCPEAPCPPADPVGAIDFIVAYSNAAPSGAFLWSNQAGLSIENSIIELNEGVGVDLDGDIEPPTWRYNDTRPRSFDGMSDPTGTAGNISANPLFVAPAAGDFRLGAGSPARDAGDPALSDSDGSRADMGRFGGM
ncbi:MAG TPA: NosD domain-containing protein [Kofleriaceae bacterium]|nr:NosD domain-containing protein [Kofleriaceae bacterium]